MLVKPWNPEGSPQTKDLMQLKTLLCRLLGSRLHNPPLAYKKPVTGGPESNFNVLNNP
jgi:hypothetical protein